MKFLILIHSLQKKAQHNEVQFGIKWLQHSIIVPVWHLMLTSDLLEIMLEYYKTRHKKKLRAEEKATGIVPDEPTELENLLEQIIALEESAEAEQQETGREKNRKIESDRAKAEDIRLKAMEKLKDTQKRQSDGMEDNQSKRPRRSDSSAISYLSQRADINYELKQEELKLKRDRQEFEKKQMEVSANAQKQFQEQQSQLLKVVLQQQQQQSQQTLLMMQQQQ